MPKHEQWPIEVFYSYSRRDRRLLEGLRTQLALIKRDGVISDWHDGEIGSGTEWREAIRSALNRAHIILLLISPDFLASDFIWDEEMQPALARHDRGEARVIPVILRPCHWQRAPFAKLQPVPNDGKPVTNWKNRDNAFL